MGSSLHVKAVTKRFGQQEVLTNMNFKLDSGDFVAIVGKSGCGKSTLLRLIAGLDNPSEGTVFLNDNLLKGLSPTTRVMFQDARLLPWKRVIDNVGVGLSGNWKKDAIQLLQDVGLAERASEWPSVLSGGQRQRVALARALVSKPSLLLLDEPLSALDALTRMEMQHLIEQLWMDQRFSALLVTHDVEEAVALANRIVVIEHGTVVMDLPICLDRPRNRSSPAYAFFVEKILHRVMGGVATTKKTEPSLSALASCTMNSEQERNYG